MEGEKYSKEKFIFSHFLSCKISNMVRTGAYDSLFHLPLLLDLQLFIPSFKKKGA